MSDNIKVVVKVRPLISREVEDKLPYQWRVQSNTLYQLDSSGRDGGQTFTFDKVYDEATKTTDVFNDVAKPIVEAATAGFNGTIFAYGQTSSGKTYTMTGTATSPGIIPLSILNLFKIIKNIPDRDFLVRVSYIEIYNETVKDLLDMKKENIRIHETYDHSIKVDVTERVTSSPEEVLEAMREGEANRQTGATNMNEKSSRSHSIFQITIESREHIEDAEQAGSVNVSQLNLVDLAGSERAGQTGATGKRFKEGTHINKSLSVLALVIKQLSEDPNKYANYRDSKLTRILQNSLGGNAKTSIICAITPTALEETISTLQFANRAKAIKNKPEVNAVATDATMIQSLTKQLSKLQSQLESKKNLEVMLANKKNVEQDLQKQIEKLKEVILNFATPHNIEGTRRKLQPTRRITISALPSIVEDPVPTVPRFCTPSMKYNSMLIHNPTEAVVQSSSNTLASLPEESPQLITPPPNDKKVNFNEDVIEIDSDDDENSTIPSCSPYHKCYSVSKTPPCVLRKNLNRAEKNYQEIVELTEREKMYTPNVVELMEKLELSRTLTEKLQDEVDMLKKASKEKDLEMEHLIFKIKKTEDEVNKAKMELETCCKEYDTKLTDWEVSYDVLKKKAMLREEELLSLLKEQKYKYEDIGKLLPTPVEKDSIALINMSKDISLVNSDNESSVTTSNEDESSQQLQDLVASLQDQLIAKSQTIIQLEANIASQKKSIEFLEQSSHQLQASVDSFKEKNCLLEKENDLYKSSVDILQKNINSLKEQLNTNQNDMSSYISVIQELQIKLTKKDNLLNMNITDSVLDSMIANEEKVFANNENMKNIIQSFKIALDKRNKEIEHLKTSIQKVDDSRSNALIEDVRDKTKQIEILNEEISKLKEQAKDNITTINNLIRDKTYLAGIEQELTKKLTDVESQKTKFDELNKENVLRIGKLEENNKNLLQCLSDRDVKEKEYILLNNELQNKFDELSDKIILIEEEIKEKDFIITTLNKQIEDKQEYEHHAKSALDKLKKVISILNGDVQEIPELIENFVILFKALSSGLSILENVAIDTISEKSVVVKENSQLKTQILDLNRKFETEKTALQHEIENLNKSVNNYLIDMENIKHINKELSDKIFEQRKEICAKCDEYDDLLTQYNTCKDAENDLRTEVLHKQLIISSFDLKEGEFKIKIDDLEAKLQNSDFALKSERGQLQLKVEILAKTLSTIEELKSELKDKCKEVTMLQEKFDYYTQVKDRHIENIFNKLCDVTQKLNIESTFLCENENNYFYEHILLILDQISSQISQTTNYTNAYSKNNIEHQMLESDEQIERLIVENRELKMNLSQIRDENKVLTNDLEKNNMDKKSLCDSLKDSNRVLEQLRNDLECKASEIEEVENKTKECKEQFLDLDILMNRQMQDLRFENETLKARCLVLNNEKQNIQTDILSNETYDYDSNLGKPLNALSPKTKQPLNIETISPPSLLTICCKKIVEHLEPKQNDNNSTTSSNSDTEVHNSDSCSKCDQLSLELRILHDKKTSLSAVLEQLAIANKELLIEQENIRQEIQLLLEPAQKLQKKISSHKTNLSILTATTYAENKSLKSQVKALQHHHRRLHNVCQGDIPEFKRQLNELFTVLKGDSSVSGNLNTNLKRHSLPDVLDNNSTISNFKNESTLNGDLLMLDTNVTLTTTGDNTLVGCDQTCLDLNLTMFNEISCQTNDASQMESNNIHTSVLENGSRSMFTSLEELRSLKEENCKLKALVDRLSKTSVPKFDAQSSPIKITSSNDDILCNKCRVKNEIENNLEKEEINHLTQKLAEIHAEKQTIEKKYNNLVLEMPNTDALASKLNALEKESNTKANEVSKLTESLNRKNKELRILQEEYDALSTQIMENISEADDLNKELDRIKGENLKLTEKVLEMDSRCEINAFECPKCHSKDEGKHYVTNNTSPHSKLNRSFSDSDTSSRYNKICTLQSELYAGREDCKVLTADVASIKQHLDCSNVSMDLDESMGGSDVFSQTKNFVVANPQHTKCMPEIQEERPSDIYTVDKIDCYNYYLELTGVEKELLSNDVKIIDIMKMFYNKLLAKHCNEIQNLTNKLKDHEESRNNLQKQVDEMVSEYSTVKKTLEEKEKHITSVSQLISGIKCTMKSINNNLSSTKDSEALTNVVNIFKLKFLCTLDYEFGISSVSVFEFLVNKYQSDLMDIGEQCIALENEVENLKTNLCVANSNLEVLKSKLNEKENESNLLKAQNEKIHEISSAVTLDIVRKEQEMHYSLRKVFQKLVELNILSNFDLSESANENINVMVDSIINQIKLKNYQEIENEKETLSHEVKKSKNILVEKEKELNELKSHVQTLKDINNNVTLDLNDKELKLQTLKTEHDELNKAYDCKIQENTKNLDEIDRLTEEITSLRETINDKELKISSLTKKDAETAELLNSIKNLQEDNERLKSVNQMILNEKHSYSIDLEKSSKTIKQNNVDMEKMTSDILLLRESVKEATSIIESLKQEVQKLSVVNAELKLNFEEKNRDCSRLEMNIKTHEKTAEIQSRMITRLQKQKEDDYRVIGEIKAKIDEVNERYNTLQNECQELRNTKESLKARVTELEEAADKPRLSLDAIPDSSRRRRQSMHDSKRLLSELDEHRNLEAMFESRQKPDDLFMDVDGDDTSGRSTPFGLGKGRDSLLSRTDQSDKDEEHSSRPSSVLATRRRRQSIHDLHRGVPRQTPSPHDLSSRANDDLHRLRDSSGYKNDSSEANQLREQLTACQQELEDLKEKYRELDEECETCAEYLRERDEQCLRLKKEKATLEKQVTELKICNQNSSQHTPSKPSVANVAVNTDEDWANLHAVVVDRMSYDAEVDKNKRLTRTIEELRFQKQDLKNTMAMMQKALEKQQFSKDTRELETTKKELKSVKEELEELKVKYKELDEECETCAEYLKEREEQCRKLKEVKAALESKLQELQEDAHTHAHSHSLRKKRQTLHDMNRSPVVDQTDASTATNDDLSQTELDDSTQKVTEDKLREIKRLKMIIEKLTHQKAALELQLRTVQTSTTPQPMYVATGSAIVQNQQLTDVIKENQRLKKLNAKLVNICKKRGKSDANRENEDPCEQS